MSGNDPGPRAPGQCEQLLELLRSRGERGVTSLDALNSIGSFRLASRIYDLKSDPERWGPLNIEKRSVLTEGGARIACYVLLEDHPAPRLEQTALGLV